MQKRNLGRSGLDVSAIGYGTDRGGEEGDATAHIAVHGDRYPAELQARVGR